MRDKTQKDLVGIQSEHDSALETLEFIAEGYYNLNRPSSVIIEELVQVIRLMEQHQNILGGV